MKKIISFPHLGNYYIPVGYFINKITKCEVRIPPKITNKTKELGSKYSPDFVCSPFKFNLGNYIEALENGANVLIQAGGGCRYGYYGELQEKILRELGYKFEFINLIKNNHVSILNMYKFAKSINKNLNIFSFSYYLVNMALKILSMDNLDIYIRKNKGFEKEQGQFNKLYNKYLNKISVLNNPISIISHHIKYKKKLKNIILEKPNNYLKVAIIGELYTIMEKKASSNIEEKLIKEKIEVFRNTNLTYLLLKKRYKMKKMLRKYKNYITYPLGADGTESVILSEKLAQEKYDGIIHLKSFGCTPEINAMPILNKISKDYDIPIIYFSFDVLDNETNVNTRLEAFCEMIKHKKEK